jgi:tetratricopeptide (TPR) repeat protein
MGDDLGVVQCLIGDFSGAAGTLDAGLAIAREIGDGQSQATALRFLAAIGRQTGEYASAAAALEAALVISRDLGDRQGEAVALNYLAEVRRMTGDYPGDAAQAEASHRQALELAREIGSTWDEAHALAGLGRWALVAGRGAEAESFLRLSLTIFRGLGAGEAADVATELDALGADGEGRAGERLRRAPGLHGSGEQAPRAFGQNVFH